MAAMTQRDGAEDAAGEMPSAAAGRALPTLGAALFVLLAQAAAAADKPECLFTGPHISFYGADPYHEQIPAASAATCCYLCAETPKCIAFEYNEKVNGGTCFLKENAGIVPRVLEGAQSGVLIQPGTAISAEAVRANHAATTGLPAVSPAPAATTAAGAAAAGGAVSAASAAGGSAAKGARPVDVLQLGSSLSAASGGAPGGDIGGGELRRRQLRQCTWKGCQ
ncbi:hypothetical protein ABPG75_000444 [Micractinium tetrahymenae]